MINLTKKRPPRLRFLSATASIVILLWRINLQHVIAFISPVSHRHGHQGFPLSKKNCHQRSTGLNYHYSSGFSRTLLWANMVESNEVSVCEGAGSPSETDKHRRPLKRAVNIYVDYMSRLWRETSIKERKRIARDNAVAAIKRVEHIMKGEEYVNLHRDSDEARRNLLESCQVMLEEMKDDPPHHYKEEPVEEEERQIERISTATTISTKKVENTHTASVLPATTTTKTTDAQINGTSPAKNKKPRRSILFGALMGAVVACWVFSGNYIFTGLFALMTVLGQLEYYRMIMNTGIFPARRISCLGAASMFITALFAPNLHQLCLPLFGCWAMIWFLTMRRQVTTIAEIATTFTGMFLLGYIPSFWVRTRLIGMGREPTRLAPIVSPLLAMVGRESKKLPNAIPQFIHLPITTGSVFIFWSWLCIAFSDVGGYFVGRSFGKTKLSAISPAAGATSPNKTVEGVLGACGVSAMLGILGAWVQKWPYWLATGALHGTILGLLGLVGDLTASMLKRDAGLKDFGDLIPDHGGILDRVDSFIFTAPYSFFVCAYIIPALKTFAKR